MKTLLRKTVMTVGLKNRLWEVILSLSFKINCLYNEDNPVCIGNILSRYNEANVDLQAANSKNLPSETSNLVMNRKEIYIDER